MTGEVLRPSASKRRKKHAAATGPCSDPFALLMSPQSCSESGGDEAAITRSIRDLVNDQPFSPGLKCPQCTARFYDKEKFISHVEVHEYGHRCPICDRRFTKKGNMKDHIRTHTGEKPHACPKCARHFAQRSNMRKHSLGCTGERRETRRTPSDENIRDATLDLEKSKKST